jgi:two-component system, NtrC family, nitrogen regulation response regulator GlnG
LSTAAPSPPRPSVATARSLVLVIDDEPSICWGFERMLREEGHHVLTASSAEEGLKLAAEHQPALIVLDVRLPGQDGISALPEFLRTTNHAPVVVMTAFGDLETAVGAVRAGACDYLIKPFPLDNALQACRRALQRAPAMSPAKVHPGVKRERSQAIIGQSAAMQHAFRQIALVADSDLSVLITGETGTGKELVAAAIHRHSQRSEAIYLPVAPVAFNPELIESELFGHVKGAFTGATTDRLGLFEQAEGGTILLDEIGELPLGIQAKLLRVLESGHISRVGDVRVRRVNVRILAATHCDLHQAVMRGTFRQDLFYRLNGVQIHLPPLRERVEDIPQLCEFFLRELEYPRVEHRLDERLLEQLSQRPWYGNIRELRNAVEHAAVLARGRQLRLEDFPPPQPQMGKSNATEPEALEDLLAECIVAWTRRAIANSESDKGNLQPLPGPDRPTPPL